MKGGHTPIHIMRWAPADFVNDSFVRLLVAKADFETFTFYALVLNWSHIEGGTVPADPEKLAALVGMKKKSAQRALAVCVKAGKLHVDDEVVYHHRVKREVARELEFRAKQAELGRLGGQRAGKGRPKGSPNEPLNKDRGSPNPRGPNPPSPSPSPINGSPPPPQTGGAVVDLPDDLDLSDNGDDPNGPRAQADLVEAARLYAIQAGFHPSRQERRQMREAVLAGHTLEDLKTSIDEARARGQPTLTRRL